VIIVETIQHEVIIFIDKIKTMSNLKKLPNYRSSKKVVPVLLQYIMKHLQSCHRAEKRQFVIIEDQLS
jgi:hypothetical protein